MKKTAYIINTARGPVINEQDLIKALQGGEIAGAALDVLEKDGVTADNPLLKMENVIITPHAAWYSEESIIRRRTETIENVIRVLQGGEPSSFVNKNLLQKNGSDNGRE
jgi:D-3-phosphoglycerate dehydrogenase